MRFKIGIVFFSLLIPALIQAQTADEIIKKHLEVAGGVKNLKKVNNVSVFGRMEFRQGSGTMSFVFNQIQTRDGKHYFELLDARGNVLNIRAYDGKTAWTGTQQKSEIIGGEEKKEMEGLPFMSRFLEPEIHAKGLQKTGLTGGKYNLLMKDRYDTYVHIDIDEKTLQIVRESSKDYEGKRVVVEMSKFELHDGISFPMMIKTTRDPDSDNDPKTINHGELQIFIQEIDMIHINQRIPANKFKRPEDK